MYVTALIDCTEEPYRLVMNHARPCCTEWFPYWILDDIEDEEKARGRKIRHLLAEKKEGAYEAYDPNTQEWMRFEAQGEGSFVRVVVGSKDQPDVAKRRLF